MSYQVSQGVHTIPIDGYGQSQYHSSTPKSTTFVYVRDWRVWSWLNFIFNPCSFICTIPALIFSYLTETYNRVGDHNGARSKSRCALGCNIAALIWFLLYIAGAIVGIVLTIERIKQLGSSYQALIQT